MSNPFKEWWKAWTNPDTYNNPMDDTKPKSPLENRISIEARELDNIIEYFKDIRKKLEYVDIVNAEDVAVASQKALEDAEHAKNLAETRRKATSVDKRIEGLLNSINGAAKNGYYGNQTYYFDLCFGHITKESYYQQEYENAPKKLDPDYYVNLLNTTYMYVAIKELQRKGYSFRTFEHSLFIFTNESVPDCLKIRPECLQAYKDSQAIDELLRGFKENAKDLYKEYPELFSHELKKEFDL